MVVSRLICWNKPSHFLLPHFGIFRGLICVPQGPKFYFSFLVGFPEVTLPFCTPPHPRPATTCMLRTALLICLSRILHRNCLLEIPASEGNTCSVWDRKNVRRRVPPCGGTLSLSFSGCGALFHALTPVLLKFARNKLFYLILQTWVL